MSATTESSGIGRASMKLASGTVVSRILGFISAIILARTLGIVGAGADTVSYTHLTLPTIYSV